MLVTDGVTTDYQQCSSVTYNGYALQKNKPNDWDNNFLNYYVLKKGKYTKIEDIPRYYNPWFAGAIVPKWQKNKFYSPVQKSKAPAWDKTQKYFKKIQKTVAPTFQKNNTFVKVSIVQPPEFTSGKFYSREVKTVVDFKENEFYEEHSHYDYFGKPYKLEDYFDRRKSTNFTLFDYCPYCGEKINWKELKERNKNEN